MGINNLPTVHLLVCFKEGFRISVGSMNQPSSSSCILYSFRIWSLRSLNRLFIDCNAPTIVVGIRFGSLMTLVYRWFLRTFLVWVSFNWITINRLLIRNLTRCDNLLFRTCTIFIIFWANYLVILLLLLHLLLNELLILLLYFLNQYLLLLLSLHSTLSIDDLMIGLWLLWL
jgi:hypothetical protein